MAVGEVCRKLGIAEAKFFVWRMKYGGLGPSELKRLRLLEEGSGKVNQLVADPSLDKSTLQELVWSQRISEAYAEASLSGAAAGAIWQQ
ncbi:TPA: transposase [Stenotrophomonas maltophilia]|nr:transposase [Stenotrophomonas maltophilia]